MLKKVKTINESIPNIFKYVSHGSVKTGKALKNILESGNAFVILSYGMFSKVEPLKMLASYINDRPNQGTKIKNIELEKLNKNIINLYNKIISPIVRINSSKKTYIAQAIDDDIKQQEDLITALVNDFNLNKKSDIIYTVNEKIYTFVIQSNVFFILPRTFLVLVDYCYQQNVHPPLFAYNVYKEFYKPIENDEKFKPEELILGGDPEFNIYEKHKSLPLYNRHKSATSYFIMPEEVGCDGSLGELRPQPSNDPLILTNNIKQLLTKVDKQLKSNKDSEFFIEAGGGCRYSIGGHIHLGHNIFCNMSKNEIKNLMIILDDFLYYPIRNNMLGGLRGWQDIDGIQIGYDDYNERVTYDLENTEEVIKKLKAFDPKNKACENYDSPSAYRAQPHGLEYRSLPSFIIDPRFTYLVLKLAKGISVDYLTLRDDKKEIEYNNPPEKKDYQKYLTSLETTEFFSYLYGKKREAFLKNVLDNWDIKHLLNISIYNETHHLAQEMLNEIEKELNQFFQKQYEKIKKDIFQISLFTSEHLYPDKWLKIEPDAQFMATPKRIIGNFPKSSQNWLYHSLKNYDLIITFNDAHYLKYKVDKTYWIDVFKKAMDFYLEHFNHSPYFRFHQPLEYTEWEKKENARRQKEQERYLKQLQGLQLTSDDIVAQQLNVVRADYSGEDTTS